MYFYAAGDDLPAVARLVLEQTSCRLYESDSAINQPLRQLGIGGVAHWFETERTTPRAFYGLVAWSSTMGPEIRTETVTLNAPGAGVRQIARGWGLISIMLTDVRGGKLGRSQVSANSEARARRLAGAWAEELGSFEAWDWREVTRMLRRIERLVQTRLVVGRNNRVPMLAGARNAFASGTETAPL